MKVRNISMSYPRIKNAQLFCDQNGHRLTEPRLRVLEIISQSDKPIGAYDILKKMGKQTKPPTVYRALEFWEEHGFIHRIASLNAYTFCQTDHRHKGSQFMICDACGKTVEAHLCHIPSDIENIVIESEFKNTYWNLEIHGTCYQCQAS